MKIHGLHDDWNATDEGDAACYAVPPELVPALERAVDAVSQAARVIYELRLEITRLNDEVMARGAR